MPDPRAFVALAALTLTMGCASSTSTNPATEQAALMQVSRDWAQASASGDVERIVSFWADDAVVLPPGQPAVVGKAAIREYVRAGLAMPGFSITWEPERASVSSSGDVGYLVERNRVTMADAEGHVRAQEGKAVTIWRKDGSGAWKCVVDTWNANPDPDAPVQVGQGRYPAPASGGTAG